MVRQFKVIQEAVRAESDYWLPPLRGCIPAVLTIAPPQLQFGTQNHLLSQRMRALMNDGTLQAAADFESSRGGLVPFVMSWSKP